MMEDVVKLEETTPVDESAAEKGSDDGLDRKTLFVRSIPYEATSEELTEFFSQFVPVKHAVIVNDDQRKSRGFGFASFTLDDDALTALIESRKVKFKGRILRVDIAKRRDRKETEKVDKTDRNPIEKRRARLIVRNIPWSLKKPEELKNIFQKFGAVFDAYIPTKRGGQMLGFAFVVMKKHAAAEKAVNESIGLKIHGREVAVDFAVEKSKWEKMKDDDDEKEDEEEKEQKGQNHQDNNTESKEESIHYGTEDGGVVSERETSSERDSSSDEEINSDGENSSFSDSELIESESEEDESPKRPRNIQEPFSIFVRNIPYDADTASLKEHFSQFGAVKYALPVMDKETGLSKGSAFVAFVKKEVYDKVLEGAPSTSNTSLLIPDDVGPGYVFSGRVLSIISTVDRGSAKMLAERNSLKRKEVFGKAPGEKDKRNLFLLNEGRVTDGSKLAQKLSQTDMQLREKSFKLRVDQLKQNPSLHLSLTRLALRNLPRSMNSKALKALGRKAVVTFASEVKESKRQPLSKEEIRRSVNFKKEINEDLKPPKGSSQNAKHKGVVKQAKVVNEVKGSGEIGRSRGYGFIEFRDHKSALMGLRWLNGHEVTKEEILQGTDEREQTMAQLEGLTKRRLIVEFAIENAKVVKRRMERIKIHRFKAPEVKKRKFEKSDKESEDKSSNKKQKNILSAEKKAEKSSVPESVKKIIGSKRRKRKNKSS